MRCGAQQIKVGNEHHPSPECWKICVWWGGFQRPFHLLKTYLLTVAFLFFFYSPGWVTEQILNKPMNSHFLISSAKTLSVGGKNSRDEKKDAKEGTVQQTKARWKPVFDPVPAAKPGSDKMIRKVSCFLSVQLTLPAISPIIISSPVVCLLRLPTPPSSRVCSRSDWDRRMEQTHQLSLQQADTQW